MTNNLVASAVALETGNTQAFETKDLVLLRAGRNLDEGIAFQRGDFDLSSEYGSDKLNREHHRRYPVLRAGRPGAV